MKFVLPDLVSHCTYPLHLNPHCAPIARASERWLLREARHSPKRRLAFLGLKAGDLTAACYPNADPFRLRVCSDFMNFLFNLDDWLDEFGVEDTHGIAECCLSAMRNPHTYKTSKRVGNMTKSIFRRLSSTAGPNGQARFIHSMSLFFSAVAQQAHDRQNNLTPDLQSYITMRRDTSGCKPCFQLIEFAAGIDLPEEVLAHPVLSMLEEATNDLVTWSNDIFSYNIEQSRRDTHNMVAVLMKERKLSLQDAVDLVGQYCDESMARFERERKNLPTWGEVIDRDVKSYVDGLQNWIVGCLHWSFETTRYFGPWGPDIKKHRIVELLPKVNLPASSKPVAHLPPNSSSSIVSIPCTPTWFATVTTPGCIILTTYIH